MGDILDMKKLGEERIRNGVRNEIYVFWIS